MSSSEKLMDADDPATRSIHVNLRDAEVAPSETTQKQRRWQYFKHVPTFAAFLVMLSAAGWGIWQYFESTSVVVDQDTIADLEAFESAPVLLPGQRLASEKPAPNSVPALPPPLDAREQASTESSEASQVWLTGTIEDVEPANGDHPSVRISDGSAESTSLR